MQPQPRESPVQDSPVQAQAPQVQPAQEQAGSGSQPALKPAATAKTRAARRHRKAILLPQITQLALEGQTGRAIALRFNLPTRTVNHWLREMRSEWLAAATHSGADLMAVGLARLDGIYCEAMEAWRRTQTEIQPPAKAKSQATIGDRPATRKGPRRRQPGDALLGRAISAVRESLKCLEGSARAAAAAPPRSEPQRRSTEDLERMSNAELIALEAALKAERELAGNDRNCPNKPAQGEIAPNKAL